jgi:hypothetical protein
MEYKINNNISNDENDWRFQGQDKYLMNIQLMFSKFDNSVRDHDHCDFCKETFSEMEEDLHEGYCTLDKYHWICEKCFKDFKDMFKWQVVG